MAAFDHIGGQHLRTVSMAALRPGGTAVLYGGYDIARGGRLRLSAMVPLLLKNSQSILNLFSASQGIVGYNVTSWRNARPECYRQDLATVLNLIGQGQLDPLIGATFPIREAAKAQQTLETSAVAGKVVLTI